MKDGDGFYFIGTYGITIGGNSVEAGLTNAALKFVINRGLLECAQAKRAIMRTRATNSLSESVDSLIL